MSALVDVKEVQGLENSAHELQQVQSSSENAANLLREMINALILEAEADLAVSTAMLGEAQIREAKALAELVAAEAELASAGAEMAAATASGNPFAIAAASARLAAAEARFAQAKAEYDAAVQHRERMERRVELCQEALRRAQDLNDRVSSSCQNHLSEMEERVQSGNGAFQEAHSTLEHYHGMTTSVQRQAYKQWKQPEKKAENEGKPVMPPEIIARLNPSKTVMLAILAELTATEPGFRQTVERLKKEAEQGDRAKAELTIRRNLSGRLAEEIVKKAFQPYGTVHDQTRKELEESYTKVDLLLTNANTQLILNRGLSVPKGGSLGIEVKTGTKSYLQGQKDHLVNTQIPGHAGCDASCVLMSRDIHNLSSPAEDDLREAVGGSGSRVLAMLPMKEELDDVCIEFVLGAK